MANLGCVCTCGQGIITLHYCREKDTCRRIKEDFIKGQTGEWPATYMERWGLEWVQMQRLKIIKDKVSGPSQPRAFQSCIPRIASCPCTRRHSRVQACLHARVP